MREQFGEARSFEALRASPVKVAKHMAWNAIKLPYNIFRTINPAEMDLKYYCLIHVDSLDMGNRNEARRLACAQFGSR